MAYQSELGTFWLLPKTGREWCWTLGESDDASIHPLASNTSTQLRAWRLVRALKFNVNWAKVIFELVRTIQCATDFPHVEVLGVDLAPTSAM
jgi:hypothetical protein